MSVDEKRVKEIEKETKDLLDKFSKQLSVIGNVEESNVVRDEDRRNESEGEKCDEEFRDIMFSNAVQKNKDFIIAEKKKW